jgi:ankyrin repeat protein
MSTDELFALIRTGDLKSICNLDLINYSSAIGKNGQTALHEAISFSQNEIAKHFVENGISLNAVCKKGQTALHYSALYKNLDLVVLLLSKGADVNLVDVHGNNSAWYSALTAGNPISLEIFTLLKKNGVNLERKNLAGRSIKDVYPLA